MPKFHINPETGSTGVCHAKPGLCPFAADPDHYENEITARKAYELKQKNSLSIVKKIPEKEVLSLIEELRKAAEDYYQSGVESSLSDDEFDAKQSYLQYISDSGQHHSLFEEGSVGFKLLEGDVSLGTTVSSDEIIQHKIPMLSLNKAKKEEDLYSFLEKTRNAGAKGFRLQAKLDGLAISVHYKDGSITQIATRGDGSVGEDVTYLIKDPKLTIKGLPLTISEKDSIEVRGELFFTDEQFKKADDTRFKMTGERFKNSRNSATGLVKKAKLGLDYPVEFTYSTYSVVKNSNIVDLSTLDKNDGFLSADSITEMETKGLNVSDLLTDAEVMKAVQEFGIKRESFGIPTDGVVIKPTNEGAMYQSMGITSHHPVSQIAWKYPAEKAKTTILKINITVGKSGRVTPIANVEPVQLAGSEISNASLHNFNLIHSKGIRIGSVVLIEKANDIIPQVVAVLSNPEDSVEFPVPKNCPSCGTELIAKTDDGIWPPKTLNCPSANCSSRDYFALKTAVGKNFLDIDKLSEVTLNYFNEIGRISNIADLYTLTHEELSNSVYGYSNQGNPRRLGEKIASHILKHLELSKKLPITKVLPSLNIDLLGQTSSKLLVKRFGDLDGILNAKESEIAALEGMGEIKAKKIFEGLKQRRAIIDALRAHGVEFAVPKTSEESSGKSSGIKGLSFAISGSVPEPFANRGKWVDFVEEHGGVFHSGPKSDTSYIIGDADSTSSKTIAAKKLGIKFMSSNEFTSTFVD